MKIKFVVDSACDVPAAQVEHHQMTVLPTFVNIAGTSYADDGVQLHRRKFYESLHHADPLPTTAAPSVGVAAEGIQRALANADHIVLLSTASTLSGIYNTMRLATVDLPPERYTLIDSRQLSMGAGYQAVIGAEVAAQTGDLDATLKAIRHVQRRVVVYAGLAGMKHLRRSGRVSWAVGTMGSLLRIRPVVSVANGEVHAAGWVRKRSAWIEMLVSFTRQHAPLERVALLHTNNLLDLNVLRELVADALPDDVVTVMATPTIGAHIGAGGVGVALIRRH